MKKKILIVDDNKDILNVFGDIIAHAGFDVLRADSGALAMKIASKEIPDLILLDVMMPGMDGGEVARQLGQSDKTGEIPVIFMTSLITEAEMVGSGGKYGEKAFVSKSGSKESLIKRIKETLMMS